MKFLNIIFMLCIFPLVANAQQVIDLPIVKTSKLTWQGEENAFFMKMWGAAVVTNVSKPSLQVFTPSKGNNNGAAVIIDLVVVFMA